MKVHPRLTYPGAAVTAVIALLAACASNPVLVDYDQGADFDAFRSYAFISEHPMMRAPDSPAGSPLLDRKSVV